MNKINLNLYKTFIFDCDGVLLNLNKIKSNAFYLSTLKYGLEIANEFLDYHKNGGFQDTKSIITNKSPYAKI